MELLKYHIPYTNYIFLNFKPIFISYSWGYETKLLSSSEF
jgi:hypothetical protein